MKATMFLTVILLQSAFLCGQHVGINTTMPNRPLTIKGLNESVELVSFIDPLDSTRFHINLAGNSLNFSRTGVKENAFSIDSLGKVGIGTKNPAFPFQVNDDKGNSIIAFFRNAFGSATILTHNGTNYTAISADDDGGYTGTLYSPVPFRIVAGGISRIHISGTNGNVGIGTNNPTSKLHVTGSGFFSDGILLPTQGGIADALNYYEELTLTSRIYNSTKTYLPEYIYRVVRIGKQVTITLPKEVINLTIDNVNDLILDGLPVRFRPGTDPIRQVIPVVVNGLPNLGMAVVRNDGNIILSASITNPSQFWTSVVNGGFYPFTISYNLP